MSEGWRRSGGPLVGARSHRKINTIRDSGRLKMPEGLSRSVGRGQGCYHAALAALDVTFEGAADDLARAQPDREREREHDASEEDAECESHDGPANLQMVQHHGRGQHQHQPLYSE